MLSAIGNKFSSKKYVPLGDELTSKQSKAIGIVNTYVGSQEGRDELIAKIKSDPAEANRIISMYDKSRCELF